MPFHFGTSKLTATVTIAVTVTGCDTTQGIVHIQYSSEVLKLKYQKTKTKGIFTVYKTDAASEY